MTTAIDVIRNEFTTLSSLFVDGYSISTYRWSDDKHNAELKEFHKFLAEFFLEIWQTTNVHGVTSLQRYKIIQQSFGMDDLPENVREISSPYCNDFTLVGLRVEGDDVLITFKQRIHLSGGKEAVMEWVNIDADTKKRVAKLDQDQKPVMKELKARDGEVNVTYRIAIKFFLNILIETGRPSMTRPAPDDYIPAPLGSDMSALIHMITTNASGVSMPLPGPPRGRKSPPMMMHEDYFMAIHHPWSMHPAMRQPTPQRVFLKPDDKGRFEIIFEPYSEAAIKENRQQIAKLSNWANWKNLQTVPTISLIFSRIKETLDSVKNGKA